MNKNLIFLLVGLIMGAITILAFRTPSTTTVIKPSQHICVDPTHQYCDGQCTCDGLGCNTATNATQPLLRSYQLQIVDDNVLHVYDGFRFVGKITFGKNKQLDRLIMRDNE